MLKKLALVTIALALAGALLWSLNRTDTPKAAQSEAGKPLLAALDSNALSALELRAGAEAIRLSHEGGGAWVVQGLDYTADSKKVQELMVKLLNATLGDQITNDAKNHERFELLTVEQAGGQWTEGKTGKRLTLLDKDGKPAFDALFGKVREGGGQYVRRADSDAVHLLPDTVYLEAEAKGWLDDVLVGVDGEKEAAKVTLVRPGKPDLTLTRENAEAAFVLEGLAEGEKLNASAVRSLADAIDNLRLDGVRPAGEPAAAGREALAVYTATLFDGRVVVVEVGEKALEEGGQYVASVRMDPPAGDAAALKEQADAFNARRAGKWFVVDSWIGERFLKERKDLIEAPEAAAEGDAATAPESASNAAPEAAPATEE